jgi:hypothetical protein
MDGATRHRAPRMALGADPNVLERVYGEIVDFSAFSQCECMEELPSRSPHQCHFVPMPLYREAKCNTLLYIVTIIYWRGGSSR